MSMAARVAILVIVVVIFIILGVRYSGYGDCCVLPVLP
jgi:hypothetical protein